MDLKVGEKINMKSPDSQIAIVSCHVEAIVHDPKGKSKEENMIVYRYWSKYRQRWFWKVHPYWILAMYNNWECEYIKQ